MVLTENLTIRPISGPDELSLFNTLPYVLNEELEDDLAAGRRQAAWMWVAVRGDRVVARIAWWGRESEPVPLLLDIFDLDDAAPDRRAVGERLVAAAMAAVVPEGQTPPEYLRMVPPDWHDDPVPVQERLAILADAGARPLVERLRFEWRPGTPLPEPRGRLAFRPVRDEGEMIDLMTEVLEGTLDGHSRNDLRTMSPREAARSHFDGELAHYRSPRDWWLVGTLPDGEPVGFACPARNEYGPIVGYIAVRPGHRGKGYIDDLLGEATRFLAGQDVPRIRASTDVGNVPMARAFERAGFANFERVVTMIW
nr:GNAT family N-acetyltransferase [Phytohabitans houttuyneae]